LQNLPFLLPNCNPTKRKTFIINGLHHIKPFSGKILLSGNLCGTTMPDEKCPVCPECGWTKCTGTYSPIATLELIIAGIAGQSAIPVLRWGCLPSYDSSRQSDRIDLHCNL